MALPRWFAPRSTTMGPRVRAREVKPLRSTGPERMEDRCSPTTWLGTTSGNLNFSTAANWDTGVPASSANTALDFTNYVQAGYTANNDLGTFTLNSLSFNARYGYFQSPQTYGVTGSNIEGSAFNFTSGTGGNPTIVQNGTAAVSLGLSDFDYSAPLSISGTGVGTLFIEGQPSPTGSVTAIINVNRGTGDVTVLDAGSSLSAQINLNSGTLEYGSRGDDEGDPLVANGGSITFGSTAGSQFEQDGGITLNKTLVVGGVGDNTAVGVITGTGGLTLKPLAATTFTIENADDYAGATVAGSSLLSAKGATFVIGSNGDVIGEVLKTSSLTAARGGTIEVDNTSDPITNTNPDHIADTTPITLESGGTFDFVPYVPPTLADNDSTETVGSLNVSGNPTVRIAGKTGTDTSGNTYGFDGDVTYTDYNQSGDAAVLYQGQNLGSTSALTNNDHDYFTNDAGLLADLVGGGGGLGSVNISILPSAYGNTWTSAQNGAGNTLATYTTATGIRPLQFDEYASSILSGETITSNVRLTGSQTLTGSNATHINSLVLASNGASAGAVQGTGELTIDSGVLLASGTGTSVGIARLDLGSSPGNLIVTGGLTINGSLVGFSGYSKSGSGTLTLTGTNTGLGGTVTLTGGTTVVSSANTSLGGSGLIELDGGTLEVTGTGETVTRGLDVLSGDGFIDLPTAGVTEAISGSVNGAGDLHLTGAGNLELSGTNSTYTGNYVVSGGSLQIDSEAALGNAASVSLAAGTTLNLPNAIDVTRPIDLIASGIDSSGSPTPTGSATINNVGAVTVDSPILANGDIYQEYGLNKTGAGTLTINGEQSYGGVLDVAQGKVVVDGQLDALNEAGVGVTVQSGATLAGTGNIIRDVSIASGGTLSPGNTTGTLQTGALTMAAGSTFGETVGSATAYGEVSATGAIALNNATLNLNVGYTAAIGDSYTLIHNVLNSPITGTFNGLPEGSKITTPEGTFQITYHGGTGGHDVVLTALDVTPPNILSIGRGSPSSAYTNASQVTFNVDFDKKVTGVSLADFSIVGSAASAASFGTISTSDGGTTYQVVVTGLGNVNGTIGLDLTSGSGIEDHAGNLLVQSSLIGAVYTLDHVPPTAAVSLASGQNATTSLTPVKFSVTFSKAVTGFTASSVSVTGSAGAGHVTVTGSGTSYTVTVGHVAGDGIIDLKLGAGAAKDAAGNSSVASNTAAVTYNLGSLFALGAGAGDGPDVRVYDAGSAQLRYNFFAYGDGFRGGVTVATGNVDNDGSTDIVTGNGFGAGPNVKVFNGNTGVQLPGYSFYAFDPAYVGGIDVAVGDLTGSGHDDIIVGTLAGSEPHVIVFDGLTLKPIASFYAFDRGFLGGVNIAAADVEGQGYDDLIVTAASGTSPHVEVFHLNGSGGVTLVRSFIATGVAGTNGISVTGGFTSAGETNADIIVGDLANGTVAVYGGAAGDPLKSVFNGMEPGVTNVGSRVGLVDSTGDGISDTLVVGSGPSPNPRFRRYNPVTTAIIDETPVYDPQFFGGVFVG